LPCSHRK